MKQRIQAQLGFTLIEMIVSLALFSVVVTVAVGALLMLVGSNEDLQGEQSVMTNLSFVLDSMTREIRTGTDYYCFSLNTQLNGGGAVDLDAIIGDATNDCQNGNSSNLRFHGIIFKEAGDSITGANASRIMYYYDSQAEPEDGQVFRQVSGNPPQPIVSSGIGVIDMDMFVTGSEAVDITDTTPNTTQPAVTIHIEAIDLLDTDPDPKSYFVQTTVTQRALDI